LIISNNLAQETSEISLIFLLVSVYPTILSFYALSVVSNIKEATIITLPQFLLILISNFSKANFLCLVSSAENPFTTMILSFNLINTIIIIFKIINKKNRFSADLKIWIGTITFLTTWTVFRAYFSSQGYSNTDFFEIFNEYAVITNIAVTFLLIYTLINERILTGDIYLEEKLIKLSINQTDYSLFNKNLVVWEINSKPIWNRNDFDNTVNENMKKYINDNEYQLALKIYEFESKYFSGNSIIKNFNKLSFSDELNTSTNVLEAYFKLNCKFTISQYLKLIRVIRAEILIQKGFLHNSSIDNLAKVTGFNNRISLYNNYKKYLDSSPTRGASTQQ
jgi:AraC-like DNA-binding protein